MKLSMTFVAALVALALSALPISLTWAEAPATATLAQADGGEETDGGATCCYG